MVESRLERVYGVQSPRLAKRQEGEACGAFAFGLKMGIGGTLAAQRRDRQRAKLDRPCVVEKLASKSVPKIPRRATKSNANQSTSLVVQAVRLEGFEPPDFQVRRITRG